MERMALNLLASLVSATTSDSRTNSCWGTTARCCCRIERERSPIVAQGRALAAVQSGRIQALSNLRGSRTKGISRSAVADWRHATSVLRLASEDELYGNTLSPVSVFYIGLSPSYYSYWLSASSECVRMRRGCKSNSSRSNRHRAELAEHNLASRKRSERREAIETDLQRQSEALDKTNAELRITAAAFNAQEGMIVTDTKGVILSANRAFVSLTGYTMEELVGQTARLFQAHRHDASSTRACGIPFKVPAAGKAT